MPSLFGILGSGVQVIVQEKDLEEAKQIIGLTDQIVCPSCGSPAVTNAMQKGKKKGLAFLIALLFSGPIGNLLGDYRCTECGTEFRR